MLTDRLVERADSTFSEAANVVYAGDDRTPALVARVRSQAEVSAVVLAAARTGIPFAVRGRGHSFPRYGLVADGLVLDLRLMDDLLINPVQRLGTSSAATSTGSYSVAAAKHGLATGFGDNPDVGIPGLALGSGIGYLSRRDGLTLDAIVEADVTLADGSFIRASAEHNPDLFWALRGGGGNFGVVTSLHLRLAETPSITGGLLAFAAEPGTARRLVQEGMAAADELSVMINITKAPPAAHFDSAIHGKPIVTALICHSGHPDDARKALAPFRAAGTLLTDQVCERPYPTLFTLASDQAGTRTVRRTGFIETFTEQQAADAFDLIGSAPAQVAVVNIRPMGGAIARVPADSTAYAYRDRRALATIRSVDRDVGRSDAGADWIAVAGSTLGIGLGPANVNFIGEAGHEATARAYPDATLRRLETIKAAYDPSNLFRVNHNVTPNDAKARIVR